MAAGSRSPGGGNDSSISVRLFNASGASAAPELSITEQFVGASSPVVKWLNNGQFAVAWYESSSDDQNGSEIRVRLFERDGTNVVALTGSIFVASTTLNSQQAPTITALPNGGFVVSWEDLSEVGPDQSSASIRLQAFDGNGGKIGGEIVVNTTTSGAQLQPSIAALADGRVVVTWTDFSSGAADIRTQIIDPRDGLVTGTGGADTLYGHDLVGHEISAGAGNDLLLGLRQDDALYGGEATTACAGGRAATASTGAPARTAPTTAIPPPAWWSTSRPARPRRASPPATSSSRSRG